MRHRKNPDTKVVLIAVGGLALVGITAWWLTRKKPNEGAEAETQAPVVSDDGSMSTRLRQPPTFASRIRLPAATVSGALAQQRAASMEQTLQSGYWAP